MDMNTVAPGAETPASLKNDTTPSYADVRAKAKKLGQAKAAGEDALPTLSHDVVNWAYEGAINGTDTVKSKIAVDGKFPQVSHIQDIFETYTSEEGKSIHERSKGSIKTQLSKLNTFFKLGTLPKVDGPAVWQRAYEAWQEVNTPKRHEDSIPAYDYFIKVAAWQVHKDNRDAEIDDKKLMELMFRAEKGPKTVEGEIKRAMKILEDLIAGNGEEGLRDSDPLTEQAFNCLRDRLAAAMKEARIAELRAQLEAEGVTL